MLPWQRTKATDFQQISTYFLKQTKPKEEEEKKNIYNDLKDLRGGKKRIDSSLLKSEWEKSRT